jgi:hypothetical protein
MLLIPSLSPRRQYCVSPIPYSQNRKLRQRGLFLKLTELVMMGLNFGGKPLRRMKWEWEVLCKLLSGHGSTSPWSLPHLMETHTGTCLCCLLGNCQVQKDHFPTQSLGPPGSNLSVTSCCHIRMAFLESLGPDLARCPGHHSTAARF